MDGLSPEQIETGCIIIRTTSAYVDQLCGNEEAAKAFYESVAKAVPDQHHASAVACNNIVSLRGGGSHDLFDSWKRIRSVDKVTRGAEHLQRVGDIGGVKRKWHWQTPVGLEKGPAVG